MSQYLHIFIRNKDEYTELDCYGRGSTIYDIFADYAPYEKVAPVDSHIADILHQARDKKANYEKMIQDYNERIDVIKTMSGDLDERMDMINEYMDSRDEVKKDLDDFNYAVDVVLFFYNLIDNYQTNVKYEGAPDHPRMYVGIETGSNITPDMVQE